ncbi:MAG: YqeG family HAD IIIA-type phosphatase [Armatimonadetes bacterium]|nr:YqeG family HAD IIIA-type phosphatase [Armatimonadota bacterium]
MPSLWKLLTPTMIVESVKDDAIQPDQLKARGVTAIITDLDNTLVPWRHYEISPGVVEWLAKLEVAGIKICIASNTVHTERLQQLADTMRIPFVDRVVKPGTGGFWRSMQKMGSQRENTAVFGDQIFTDMLAGNRMGLTTILLRPPLSKEEFISTQLVRYVENYVIRRLRARGQWPAAEAVAAALEALPDPRSAWVRAVTWGSTLSFLGGLVALWRWKRPR